MSRTKSQVIVERGKANLQREMERRQQASKANTNGSSNASASFAGSARLEALEEIPIQSSSLFSSLLSFGKGRGRSSAETDSTGSVLLLPSDEAEILAADALAIDGPWDWDMLGLEISWATASSRDDEKAVGSVGLVGFWKWVDGLR
jgi:hypothetical protein